MSQSNHGHQKHAGPYWRRAHHDWRFYVAAFLMVAAMVSYGLRFNGISWSRTEQPQQISNVHGR